MTQNKAVRGEKKTKPKGGGGIKADDTMAREEWVYITQRNGKRLVAY